MKKERGWNEGLLSEDLTNGHGFTHKKGSVVRYKRKKTISDKYGLKLTEYEWWYLDENNRNLIRTKSRLIEGLPIIKESYLY
jgi:hypothetical protein